MFYYSDLTFFESGLCRTYCYSEVHGIKVDCTIDIVQSTHHGRAIMTTKISLNTCV